MVLSLGKEEFDYLEPFFRKQRYCVLRLSLRARQRNPAYMLTSRMKRRSRDNQKASLSTWGRKRSYPTVTASSSTWRGKGSYPKDRLQLPFLWKVICYWFYQLAPHKGLLLLLATYMRSLRLCCAL